jgi:CDP-diacylglycerol--glycerol-3-phosphate 3-phosphatidyltransferase/cardiolipin synthase
MTLATKITVFRILLIPVFAGLAIYYGQSVALGAANEGFRWAAIFTFALAAASDALDGWIARRYNQRSRLGQILDPLADKALLLSAIITLSFTSWRQHFPLWFPLLVIFRDIAAIIGAFLVDYFTGGRCEIRPHWTGKGSTFAQIAAVLWLMLDVPGLIFPTIIAAILTTTSGFLYMADGFKQIREAETQP